MSRLKKQKGQEGEAVSFISRSRAIKKLQLSLADFRRLCILKGVYPREPRNKRRVIKAAPGGGSIDGTYYAVKDVHYLARDPLVALFREQKSLVRRRHRWMARGETLRLKQDTLVRKSRDTLHREHLPRILRERYPSFRDAVRDLDDALSMLALFARMSTPALADKNEEGAFVVPPEVSAKCASLYDTFKACMEAACARDSALFSGSFISIRGIYFRVQVVVGAGSLEPVTWIEPLEGRLIEVPSEEAVDFRVMGTFLDLYVALVEQVNARLVRCLGICVGGERGRTLTALAVPADSQHALQCQQQAFAPNDEAQEGLFAGMTFAVGRECPREALGFLIRSHGGSTVGEDSDDSDPSITHEIVDRPSLQRVFAGRVYVQPQWVWDSCNARALADPLLYALGKSLPPHLSPFVEGEDEGEAVVAVVGEVQPNDAAPSNEVVAAAVKEDDAKPKKKPEKTKKMTEEQRQLAASLLTKKQRKVYETVVRAKARKTAANAVVEARRQRLRAAPKQD